MIVNLKNSSHISKLTLYVLLVFGLCFGNVVSGPASRRRVWNSEEPLMVCLMTQGWSWNPEILVCIMGCEAFRRKSYIRGFLFFADS